MLASFGDGSGALILERPSARVARCGVQPAAARVFFELASGNASGSLAF